MKPLTLKPEQETAVKRIAGEPTRAALVAAGTGCKVSGCPRTERINGMCYMHYGRDKRHGDPLTRDSWKRGQTPNILITERVEEHNGCLVWTGLAHEEGHGRIWLDGKLKPVHVYVWEKVNPKIPKGMHLDHICHNPACIKLDHLRVATVAENIRNQSGLAKNNTSGYRGVTWDKERSKWSAKVEYKGVTHNLGRYDDKEEAAEAARKKRDELFKEFAGKG